jgi:hypothetical protein
MKQSAIPLYCFTPNLSSYYFYNLVLTLSKGNDPTPITIADNIAEYNSIYFFPAFHGIY